ncbi:hypoxanthine phosphoribosyltransferase [Kiritimatiella glycovorans]|uniref:Hypoxanthine phosphoribosyltransferase n=1 Tax=Kiritimatiella glycovorans TaxID=1307763 RepID=A0A0G3EI44_9BACT|nr:hypoxanthine phosphoribosyltransferase [Kiritimatiella glycovorans]AKJ63799.1 Hypoxanthine phosphoribosyltransferase [Kiritimatiella glycovorans]
MRAHHVNDILYTAEQIGERVGGLGDELAAAFGGQDFIAVGILRGSFMFMADLLRAGAARGLHPRIDFIGLESYGDGTESAGEVKLVYDTSLDLEGARLLLIDDILDTGLSLARARRLLAARGAASVHTCVMLDKPSRRQTGIRADFTGFRVDDVFVVGYGLDYAGLHRELPHLSRVVFED